MPSKIIAVPVVAVAVAVGGASSASADMADCSPKLESSYTHAYHKVRHRLGKRAPGRNIRRYGVLFRGTVFSTTCGELRRSRGQLRVLARPTGYPLLARTAVPPAQPPAGVQSASYAGTGAGGSSNPNVNPNCESGGDPTAVSPGGTYRGKYQFDQQTWEAFGGVGDPAAAPESVQDQIAARVDYDAWPNC